MKLNSPYEQLPLSAQCELIAYLIEGNSVEDLAVMLLDNMNKEQFCELIVEVKQSHQQTGDFPYVSLLELE